MNAKTNNSVVNSKLVSVTVYPKMALIKKEITLKLKKGDNIVNLSGLTPDIIDNSVQLNSLDPNINILDIKVFETFLSDFQQEEVKKLERLLEEVERKILIKSTEKNAIQQFSSIIGKFFLQLKDQQINISAINSYFELIENNLKRAGSAIAEAEEELKRLNKEKEKLENELKNYNKERKKTKNLSILLYSNKDTRSIIEISYLVQSAGWNPTYELRVNSITNKYNIVYLAMVSQNSGENWKDAEIIVSTRKPASFKDIPVPSPWYVDRWTPPPYTSENKASIEPKIGEEKLPVFFRISLEPKVEEELAAVNFILPNGINIPSDGRSHRVVLVSQEKDTAIKYIAVPRSSSYVYLKAEFENPFDYPALPGEVKIYLDNRFVGEIFLNKTLYPGEKRDIPLGIDERIKVERKLAKKFTEYKGAFTKETAISYEYITEITNGSSRTIELELKDNLPVSRNEKIKIEIKEPKDKSMIKEDGSYVLMLKLKPGETRRLKTSFTVRFPKKWEITLGY